MFLIDFFTARRFLKYLPGVFERIDPLLPTCIGIVSRAGLESAVLEAYSDLMPPYEWQVLSERDKQIALKLFAQKYDPFVNVEKAFSKEK